jgi:rod shape-determining protein MreC
METSRDDFVIAIRSAFLKKGTQQRFSLLSLILFSIIFLILGSLNFKAINYIKIGINEIVYRSSFIVSGPENFIKENYIVVKNHINLYKENEKNKSELDNLRGKDLLNEFIILENKRLKNIVDDYLVKSDAVFAKVLSDKGSPFLKSIIINKGSKHNISLGMIAMDGEYLVGKVVEVNYMSSRVLLLSDLNSKIPVIIEPNEVFSILSGTGKNYGVIQYSKKYEDIKSESIIYTSGAGSLFKAGMPVGKIIKNKFKEIKEGLPINKIKVEFFSDFSQLRFVEIFSFTKKETE